MWGSIWRHCVILRRLHSLEDLSFRTKCKKRSETNPYSWREGPAHRTNLTSILQKCPSEPASSVPPQSFPNAL